MSDVLHAIRMVSLLGVVFAACGAIGFAAWSFSIRNSGINTMATVIDLRPDKEGFHFAVCEFSDQEGKVHTVESLLGATPANYVKGQRVPIIYSPANPKNATITTFSELWTVPIILAALAVFFLVESVALGFLERHISRTKSAVAGAKLA
jgi:hypothetical protein